jgi:hypothetical protein
MNIWTGLLLNQGHVAKVELGVALSTPDEERETGEERKLGETMQPTLQRCLQNCALGLHVRWAGFR